MKFYIIRHGETDWNNLGKIQGRIDNELNTTGIMQAENIAEFFKNIKPTHIVSSPLVRAVDTIKTIAKSNHWEQQLILDDSFIERDFGDLESCNVTAFDEVKDFTTINGYEQDETIQRRATNGLQKYLNNDDNIVVIASHSHAIRAILIENFPKQFKWDRSSRLKNCAIAEFEYVNNQLKFINIH